MEWKPIGDQATKVNDFLFCFENICWNFCL